MFSMKITVSLPPEATNPEKKVAIEAELSAYDEWFSTPSSRGGLGNVPLLPQEKAMLRTYLTARLAGRFRGAEGSGQS